MEPTRVELKVKGMHCSACAARVQRALGKVPGVTACSVDLAAERAAVQWAQGQPDVQALKDAVRAAGFSVEE